MIRCDLPSKHKKNIMIDLRMLSIHLSSVVFHWSKNSTVYKVTKQRRYKIRFYNVLPRKTYTATDFWMNRNERLRRLRLCENELTSPSISIVACLRDRLTVLSHYITDMGAFTYYGAKFSGVLPSAHLCDYLTGRERSSSTIPAAWVTLCTPLPG